MDLREKKTKRSLTNAFIEIRSKKPLERITVKELCEKAEISKATFYLHYHDIYDLSDQMQQKTIREILSHVQNTEEMLTNPRKSSKEMIEGFYANRGMVTVLFSGSQFSRLPEKIELEIKEILFHRFPELKNDIYANVRITYQLMGSFYAFYYHEKEFNYDDIFLAVDRITQLFERDVKQ